MATARKKSTPTKPSREASPRFIKTLKEATRLQADVAAGKTVELSPSQILISLGNWDVKRPITRLERLVTATLVAQTTLLPAWVVKEIKKHWSIEPPAAAKDAAKSAALLKAIGAASLAAAKTAAKKL
ncbi:MAG TPA: hypothetical protein VGM90_32165 [Kofleriaceae bacterium]|jgi:hypothetical protein